MADAKQLEQLSQVLQYTLSAEKSERKQAESYLESVESTANYGVLLLQILTASTASDVIRTAAAVTFKNFVKRNWRIIDGESSKISDVDRDLIKTNIVQLMLNSPSSIQKQLSDAISFIGREDFPEKWKNLLGDLTHYMKVSDIMDLHIINGVLQTAHSLFKRFRYEFKSQDLWVELKFVLDNFASPLLDLFEAMICRISSLLNNQKELSMIFDILTVICKLFYTLNYQDLPEFFEDNMKRWMEPFHMLIVTPFDILVDKDSDEPGPLEKIRSQICDNVALYAQKYDEEFQAFLPNFVQAIWNLLTSTGSNVKFDMLVSNAIQFLASVCERPHYKDLFSSPGTLQSICQNVIVPNMLFREADEELFEDNPEEYIRKDIEGSDLDTRRRSASDLVRGLCKFYEKEVTDIFSQYVNAMLQQYVQNKNWKSKDAAIYIVTSIAAKKSTSKHGTTDTNSLVNLDGFFNEQIAPDLVSSNIDEYPVLKADAVKYVITFRNILSRDLLYSCFPPLTRLLTSKSKVVHSYAANAIERLLTIKSSAGVPAFTGNDLMPYRDALFMNLFLVLETPGSLENEYAIKAIMRVCTVVQEGIAPLVPVIISKLSEKLKEVCKNPSKPQFNHYLFESICSLIRGLGSVNQTAVSTIEEALFPVFQIILQTDVTEFLSYVFQVLSLALELRGEGVKGPYMDLFPMLLTPVLWERQGNVPALRKLLQAYVKRGAKEIVSTGTLMPLLGVFQKLIASRTNDHEGFYILGSIVEYVPWAAMEANYKQIFMLLFQRLQTSKTTKYVKGFLVFVSLFSGKHTSNVLQTIIDGIQPKLFGMMVEKLFVADLQKISGNIERKICAVGVTKILTEAPAMLTEYQDKWVPLLQALIGLFELPEDDTIPDDEHFIDVEDTAGYQTAFSQLAFANKKDQDPFQEIPDPKEYLAKQLYRLSHSQPGKISVLISKGLNPDATRFLQGYLSRAQVQLV
ncbi:exportin-2 isoform X1 [Hydra vulgaris]|uniref:exportin-2 isoform X1 n=1 Tax=Hydra vulgaris TaxID=6087 RepID=UPI0006414009|nr:exportin-2 [Hydra vulgaris]